MIRLLRDFSDQTRDLRDLGAVGWDGVGAGAGLEVGEGVQGGDGFVAGRGFAGGDEDSGAAGLEEAGERGGIVRRE